MPEMQTPPLAVYKSIADYTPSYADFVIWVGLFRTWYGVVLDFDAAKEQVAIAFEGTPRLLFTMNPDEIRGSLYTFKLADLRKMKKGRWYVQKTQDGQNVWYI